jgi:exosortase
MKLEVQSVSDTSSLATTNRRAWFLGIAFLAACAAPALFMRALLSNLFALILSDQTFSHIPFVPIVSAYFLYAERERIFTGAKRRPALPAAIAVTGILALALARANPWYASPTNQLSLLVLGFVLICGGAFGIFFGLDAMRAGRFPLLFLGFAIPIPEPLLSEIIAFLQRGSAAAVAVIFQLFRTPATRAGFDFALPGITIRVAEECSGIRSTLALVMTAVIVGHVWLQSFWRTALLALATIPISIAKNALRIAVLSWLAVYVDRRFLTGPIHYQYGGMLFFGVGLALMGIVLLLLRLTRTQIAADARRL